MASPRYGNERWGEVWRTVTDEDQALGCLAVLWLGDVCLKTCDGVDSAGWRSFVYGAAEAAGAHSHILRHGDFCAWDGVVYYGAQ